MHTTKNTTNRTNIRNTHRTKRRTATWDHSSLPSTATKQQNQKQNQRKLPIHKNKVSQLNYLNPSKNLSSPERPKPRKRAAPQFRGKHGKSDRDTQFNKELWKIQSS
jgi:hypothetical protein